MSFLKCLFPCCCKESEIDKLSNINYKQISPKKREFYYNSQIIKKLEVKDSYHVKVIDIYDADTITVVLFFRDIPSIIKLRLLGIDTPEMKPKTDNENENIKEKALAIIAKIFLKNILEENENIIYIETNGTEKYGRTLAILYKKKGDSKSINQQLVDLKLADSYFGKTKERNFQNNFLSIKDSKEIIKMYEKGETYYKDLYYYYSKKKGYN